MKYFWAYIAGIITAVIFTVAYRPGRVSTTEIRIDTIMRIDTLRDTIPVPVNKYIVRYDSIHVPIPVEVIRNIAITDTIYVPVPIERKEYRTDEYFAIVEGYRPELSFIETYNKTMYIDRTQYIKTKPRWGIGVHAGYGAGRNGLSPYIGVGFQYNLITW